VAIKQQVDHISPADLSSVLRSIGAKYSAVRLSSTAGCPTHQPVRRGYAAIARFQQVQLKIFDGVIEPSKKTILTRI
jgi:hypothetical protein